MAFWKATSAVIQAPGFQPAVAGVRWRKKIQAAMKAAILTRYSA